MHLSPKAFDLLDILLHNRPRVVSKADLHDRLWEKTFVSDSSLARLVAELRKALGDPVRQPVFLRTVHRFGYAFCGTASEESRGAPPGPPGSTYRLVCGPREFVLVPGENTLGRVGDATAWIDSATVSRRHARVVVAAGAATIEDLGSKNGTYLRGGRLTGPAPLADGDEVRLGSLPMTFHVSSDAVATKTDASERSAT